jgi:hypothetical protein
MGNPKVSRKRDIIYVIEVVRSEDPTPTLSPMKKDSIYQEFREIVVFL